MSLNEMVKIFNNSILIDFNRSDLSKAMLVQRKNTKKVEMIYNMTIDNIFQQLAAYRGNGDGSIVTW